MLRPASLIASLLIAPLAQAQEDDPWSEPSGWQREGEAGASLLYAFDDGEPVWRAFVSGRADYVLDNGIEIGAAARFEVQQDHPARAGFSGAVPNQGLILSLIAVPYLRGAYTGLYPGFSADDVGPRGQLETAYVFASGGYGEIRLGRDHGMARRFMPQTPSIFETAALGRQTLDASGLSFVRTDHDLTGPAAKAAITTPRLLGLQAGLSFTPEVDVRGLDRDPVRRGIGSVQPELENAVEAALNLSRPLSPGGPDFEAALAFSEADLTAPGAFPAPDASVTTRSAGLRLATEDWAIGATFLSSNNGLKSDLDYETWTLGVTKIWRDYTFGAEYGQADDALTSLDAASVSIGVSRTWSQRVKTSLAWREDDRGTGPAALIGPSVQDGIVIEITLSP